MNRRKFLIAAGAAPSLLLDYRTGFARSEKPRKLPIPEMIEGDLVGGKRRFNLNVRHGAMEFFPGYKTQTLGYNGDYLGPTLIVNKGDRVQINVTNDLREETTVHWHGMVLPAKMDGGPHQNIVAGGRWRSEFEVLQNRATLFYHSHAHGNTGQQVYRGLAGLLLIEDQSSKALNLPSEYGVDDIPVVIQDRDFSEDGQFQYPGYMPERMIGKHGKTVLVNGARAPVLNARKSLIRLRLVNASNARFYTLGFDDDRGFQVIASEGGLLERPVNFKRLVLGPGERYEILVDCSDRKTMMLKHFAGIGNAGHGPMAMMGMDSDLNILLIRPEKVENSEEINTAAWPQQVDWIDSDPGGIDRELELQMGMMGGMNGPMGMGGGMMQGMMGRGGMMGGMMRINNQSFDMNRVDFSVRPNRYEVWRITNASPMLHPFHIHNTQFRILRRNGQPAYPFEQGLKDTVIVRQREKVDLLVPTGPYSDPDNPYMYHCHILEHEDGGMMGQFLVTA